MSWLSKNLSKATNWMDARTGGATPSVGGMLGTALGPLGAYLGSRASGRSPVDDLRTGARNATLLLGAQGLAGMGAGAAGSGATGAADAGATAAGTTAPSRFRSIGEFLSKNRQNILDYGSLAERIYGGYRRGKLEDEALALARQRYAENAPLREAGRRLFLDNSRPDLSGVFADPTNPAGRYRTVPIGGRL